MDRRLPPRRRRPAENSSHPRPEQSAEQRLHLLGRQNRTIPRWGDRCASRCRVGISPCVVFSKKTPSLRRLILGKSSERKCVPRCRNLPCRLSWQLLLVDESVEPT